MKSCFGGCDSHAMLLLLQRKHTHTHVTHSLSHTDTEHTHSHAHTSLQACHMLSLSPNSQSHHCTQRQMMLPSQSLSLDLKNWKQCGGSAWESDLGRQRSKGGHSAPGLLLSQGVPCMSPPTILSLVISRFQNFMHFRRSKTSAFSCYIQNTCWLEIYLCFWNWMQ
jgi:hypothetical protein